MRVRSIIAVTLLVIAATVVVAAAPGNEKGTSNGKGLGDGQDGGAFCLPGNQFENDEFRVWFHGKKFMTKVFEKTETGEDLLYQYKAMWVEEKVGDHTVATMNLHRASSFKETCVESEDDGSFLNVTFAVTDTVFLQGGDKAEATVAFEYHFNRTTPDNTTAKFDLEVRDWPWQAEGSELSYSFDVESSYTIVDAPNGIGFVNETDVPHGYITWADNATAYYPDDHEETANVTADVANGGNSASIELHFTNVTSGYGLLDYDPTIGVGLFVIIPGVILVPIGDPAALVAAVPVPAARLVALAGVL